MTWWEVRYKGMMTPEIVKAPTFMEAVAKAVELAKEHNFSEDRILSVSYLAY